MRERILRRAGAPLDIEERRALFLDFESEFDGEYDGTQTNTDLKTVIPTAAASEQESAVPDDADGLPGREDANYFPLYAVEQLVIAGDPVVLKGSFTPPTQGQVIGVPSDSKEGPSGTLGGSSYGGRTDLGLLNNIGMTVALAFERNRLRKAHLTDAEVFNVFVADQQANAWVFDVSTPDRIAFARAWSRVSHEPWIRSSPTWVYHLTGQDSIF